MLKIMRARDYDDMSRKTANIILAQVILKPTSVLGLATGTTPIGAYEAIIRAYERGDVDFSQVQTFNLDEYRGLANDDPQSYHYFMRKHLFDNINIDLDHVHVPDGSNADAAAATTAYDQMIEDAGFCDLQLLGIGRNGHIGFNEPDAAFPTGTHCVDLTRSTIEANARLFEREQDVPRQAYTMGIQSIMHSRMVIIAAAGDEKAQAVRDMCQGPVVPSCPASVLQLHPNAVLVADESALSLLS